MAKLNLCFSRAIFSLLILLALSACNAGSNPTGAPAAVEGYLQALVAKDENQMINLSCAAWEAQVRLEFNAFSAVDLKLENLECQETGQQGEYTLVTCSGSMIASYGAEDQQIDVADRTYQLIQEGGEWRVCGLHE
jgi:hypothetical protein